MKFLCEQCKTKYQISDEKIVGKTVRMKCRKCGFMIEVASDVTESSVAKKLSAAPAAPRPAARSSLSTGLSAPARTSSAARPSPLAGAFKEAVRDEASSALEILQVSSSGDWYAAINGVPVGPIRVGELRQKAAQGLVTEDTLVWQEGLEEWRPVRAMPELLRLVREAQQRPSLAPAPPRASRPPPPPPRKSLAPRAPIAPRTPGPAPVQNKPAAAAMAGADVDIDALFAPAMSQPPPAAAPNASFATPSPFGVAPHALTPSPTGMNGRAVSDPFAPAPMAPAAAPASPMDVAPMASALGDPYRASVAGVAPERKPASPPWLVIAMLLAALAFGGVAAYAIFFRQPQSVVVQMIAPPTATAAPTAAPTESAQVAAIDTAAPTASAPVDKQPRNAGTSRTNTTAAAASVKSGTDPNIAALLGGSGPDIGGPKGPNGGGGSSLTANQIQSVVANRQIGLRRQCWDRMSNTPASVKVTATVNVNGQGQVTNVTTDGNDPAVAKCIEGQVKGWTFPPTGAPSTVNIPFTFLRQ